MVKSRPRSSSAITSSSTGSASSMASSSAEARFAACAAKRFFSSRCAARLAFGSDSSTSTYSDGSSTICAKMTARAAANGRRAHHRCRVLGWPWRIDFSRADARLMASRGSATSMSFLRDAVMSVSLSFFGMPDHETISFANPPRKPAAGESIAAHSIASRPRERYAPTRDPASDSIAGPTPRKGRFFFPTRHDGAWARDSSSAKS